MKDENGDEYITLENGQRMYIKDSNEVVGKCLRKLQNGEDLTPQEINDFYHLTDYYRQGGWDISDTMITSKWVGFVARLLRERDLLFQVVFKLHGPPEEGGKPVHCTICKSAEDRDLEKLCKAVGLAVK